MKMTFKEKINYLCDQSKGLFVGILVLLGVSIIALLLSKNTTWNSVAIYFVLLVLVLAILLIIFKMFYPVNIFSKNVQITDGYLDERTEQKFSEDRRDYYATAKTMDGSKTTSRKRIPYWFRHGKVPVKIIMNNNRACDFILTKESYEYANEHRGDLEKITDKNQSIIGIILIILVIVGIIMYLL